MVRRNGNLPLVTANGGAPGNSINGGAGGSAAGQLVIFGDNGENWDAANELFGIGGGPGSRSNDFPFDFPGDGRPYGNGGDGRYNEAGETFPAETGFPGFLLIEY